MASLFPLFIQLKNRIQALKTDLEVAYQRHTKERQKYIQIGDSCQKLSEKSDPKVNIDKEHHALQRDNSLSLSLSSFHECALDSGQTKDASYGG